MLNIKLFIICSLNYVNIEGILNLISLLGNKISTILPDPVVLPIYWPIIITLGNNYIIWINHTQQLKHVSLIKIYILGKLSYLFKNYNYCFNI